MGCRWFNDRRCHVATLQEKAQSKTSALYLDRPQRVTLHMFWSPIVLIIVGLVVSGLIGAGELLWYKYRGRVSTL